ncbi:taste receptor type 2 member 8-like [Podarcis raffonei]|uniref:taste receptor type 2 member 8-like n=1 Tax=Podarcis raffonei TaxID=65483 RepID=UPI0023291C6A|nr:taste receptor type 2 member 8-like [Podarcis raffonei]
MPSPQLIAFLASLAVLAIGGLISNGFIVAVIVTEWAKSRKLDAREQLLLSLGMSNIGFSGVLSPYLIKYYLISDFSSPLILQICYFIGTFLTFSRFWLTAWLCLFYYLKIINNNCSLFLWCKLRISRITPWLLGGSQAISLLVSFFALQSAYIKPQGSITNMTQDQTEVDFATNFKIFFLITGAGCPFLIVFPCSIMVVASLYRHVYKLTGKESNIRSLQTDAHTKAAGTVLLLLVLSISFYVAKILFITGCINKDIVAISVCITMILMYSPVQAALLVLVNPKLKQAAARMLPRRKP